VDTPRVPVQIVDRSERVQAALRFAAGASTSSSLTSALCYLCEQLAGMTSSPVASVYVLEGADELVLRGNFGFTREALGEVRMKVGQGITGTCVETMSPVTANDARLTEQFEYFPQLAEERYPAFLAIPLLSGARPRGALVLQREAGPFAEPDLLLAIGASRAWPPCSTRRSRTAPISSCAARATSAGDRWASPRCSRARCLAGIRARRPRSSSPGPSPPNETSCCNSPTARAPR